MFEHLWSTAVEEQFYLVWPTLLLIIALWVRRVDVPRPVQAARGNHALVVTVEILVIALTSFGESGFRRVVIS
ncbi:hypothetical protein GCM10010178_89810 [Lentzea flava]|uniref:Uncharacterized protein n=1 Tax=Lentzea flava TaxID=103732 RepID=A0ABQ2VIR1_9PSEU|nr:hypothetical protein [Lentzea flava]GGU85735.1 hypothetical protein GCM10010178_89810 [Lentzea flava]